jgi:hypothetical protein
MTLSVPSDGSTMDVVLACSIRRHSVRAVAQTGAIRYENFTQGPDSEIVWTQRIQVAHADLPSRRPCAFARRTQAITRCNMSLTDMRLLDSLPGARFEPVFGRGHVFANSIRAFRLVDSREKRRD